MEYHEIFHQITPVWVTLLCPKCKVGQMNYTGQTIDGPVKSHRHVCSNPACMHSDYFRDKQYPQFRNVVNPQPMDPQPNFQGPVASMPGTDDIKKIVN